MRKLLFLAIPVLVVTTMLVCAEWGRAEKKTAPPPGRVLSEVVPVNDEFRGMTYRDLTAAWWQWAFGQSDGIVPGGTTDGYLLAEQAGRFWFLAGNFDPITETRSISVPYNKALFFPIYNNAYIGFPWDPRDVPELGWSIVFDAIGAVDVKSLKCEIDGVAVPGLAGYRVNSGGAPDEWSFILTLQPDNAFGLPSNVGYPTVTDGYWILLKPLSVGQHTIHFGASGPNNFILDITYNVTVTER